MKRLPSPRTVLLAALAALAASAGPAAPADPPLPAPPALRAEPPGDAAGDVVLVLRAEGPDFDETLTGLDEELEGELALEELVLEPATGAAEVAAALASRRPRAVVLMDNHAISLYDSLQKAWDGPSAPPPAVALMAVRVDQAIAGMKRVTGIFYEVPGVTLVVNLRSLLADPVRKVGVIHRRAMADFVEESARWCAAEKVELVPYTIPEGGGDVAKAVRTGVRRLWRKDGVDALWVLNDNFYLTPEIIARGWLPALERFEKPVLVGVENFVASGVKFGTFAVLPDHYGLGAQAAGLLMRLRDDRWEAPERPVLRQPLAITKHLNLRLARKYSRIREERLREIDRVVR